MALNFKVAAPTKLAANPNRTLLLVDDDQAILFALRNYFKRFGWHLLEADSIAAAMKLFEANLQYIDAVVCDYQFDGKQTGLDLVVFAQGRKRGLPCVVISGQWDATKVPRDEPDKNLFYRAKPIEPRDLLDLMNRLTANAPGTPTSPAAPRLAS
jgi:DNA-binding NtrC family response regulator